MKVAFYNVGLDVHKDSMSLLLRRFDSNFDGELTFSDVKDMFSPKFSHEALDEFERRSMFAESASLVSESQI